MLAINHQTVAASPMHTPAVLYISASSSSETRDVASLPLLLPALPADGPDRRRIDRHGRGGDGRRRRHKGDPDDRRLRINQTAGGS